jgi:hypothetical protein
MGPGKQGWIGNEALGLGPAAVKAEMVNLSHAAPALTRSQMPQSPTPGMKGRRIQIGVLVSFVVEKSVQGSESANRVVETSAQGTL